ncbi:MAG: hypothetical protein ACT4RN_08270 [Pseudonocardia sp.]
MTTVRLRARALPVLACVLVTVLAGCGSAGDGAGGNGGGSATNCDLAGCTITFQRDGTATVSVLGVQARLVGVDAGTARVEVAGQTITIPVGGTTEAGGFTVGVERVTDTEVVVRVSP